MITVYGGEEYRCERCKKEFTQFEVHGNWKCPNCGVPVNIKLEVDKNFQSCLRLSPPSVKPNDLVLLHKPHIHSVINIEQKGDYYKIALQNYGVINRHKDDFLLVINGAW